MGARFVVRVGRRWRQLDLVSGRVSGLGDVCLVRVRQGRLEVVPRAPALRALRTLLTAGPKRSAAKDGPRLSQIRYTVNPRRSKGRKERDVEGHKKGPPVHTCCHQQHYQCNTDANCNSILRPPTSTVGVQCSGQVATAHTLNTHPVRVADQTEEIQTNNQSQRVRDHGNVRLQNKNHESEELRNKDHGSERIKRRTLLGRKRQRQQSPSSSSTAAAVPEAQRTNNSPRKRGPASEPIEVHVRRNLNQDAHNKLQGNKVGVRRRGDSSEGTKTPVESNEETQGSPQCKELLITEETVMLLRGFIERDERNVFGVDLERYDADDAYKAQFFYGLNPLVNLERCPLISRMLRERASRADAVSLEDFITTLGLRSVLGSSAGQSRYRMRRRSDVTARRRAPLERDAAAGAAAPPPRRDGALEETKRNRKDKKVTSSQANSVPSDTKPKTWDSSRKELKEVAEVSSHGEERKKKKKKPDKPVRGKLGGVREYSAEEDAFIVSWVRGEGRARLVNGNRLWVQLQPLHHASTGCQRSWHSLRNRYLRYLLPALGALPLPPREAARLRAAAAAGELKARKLPARRNSAFHQPPVRSAWGRRPRPPPHETVLMSDTEETQKRTLRSNNTPAPNQSPPTHTRTDNTRTLASNQSPTPHTRTNTPTYSELTKQFARRHRSTPASDTVSLPDTVGPTDTDTASLSAPTDSTDRRVRQTRQSKRIRSSSESDSRQSPKRRNTRQSGRHVDINGRHDGTSAPDVDTKHRQNDKTGRSEKTKRPSRPLDSDTDNRLNKRTSARRVSSAQNADKSDQLVENSGQVAGKRESRKRERNTSQDSDTDSQSNKRRRSTRLDTSAHGLQNGRSEQIPHKRRAKSVESDIDTPLSARSRRVKSADRSADRSADISGRQSAKENKRRHESGLKDDKRHKHRDERGQFTGASDRQNGSVRTADRNNTTHRQRLSADKLMSMKYQEGIKSDRNDRQDGRLADNTDRHKPRTRRLYNPNAI